MTAHNFEVIILATDIFGYYWARSFHDEYDKKSYALGNYKSQYTKLSNMFHEIRVENDLFDEEVFVKTIIDYAKEIKGDNPYKEVILVPTNDHFVRYIIQNSKELEKYCLFNIPNKDLLDTLMLKENFYTFVEKRGLSIPETIFQSAQEPFTETIHHFPVIVKPSTSVGWKGLDFDKYEKVYRCHNESELKVTLDAIRETDYEHDLIIQEYIEGDDTNLWDMVSYSNKEGKVQFINMGQVLLQEPSKNMVGNYTAVMSRYNKEYMQRIVSFLNNIGYTGFANFDMKLDPKDNQFKLFEVNLRAGRSSFSAEQMGESLAKNLVDDLIYNKSNEAVHYMDQPNLFSYVPKYVLRKYVKDDQLKSEMNQLIKNDNINNPLVYEKDKSLMRTIFLNMRGSKYVLKYRKGTWNDK